MPKLLADADHLEGSYSLPYADDYRKHFYGTIARIRGGPLVIFPATSYPASNHQVPYMAYAPIIVRKGTRVVASYNVVTDVRYSQLEQHSPLEPGWYLMGSRAVHIGPLAAQQWKVGHCSNNTTFNMFFVGGIMDQMPVVYDVDIERATINVVSRLCAPLLVLLAILNTEGEESPLVGQLQCEKNIANLESILDDPKPHPISTDMLVSNRCLLMAGQKRPIGYFADDGELYVLGKGNAAVVRVVLNRDVVSYNGGPSQWTKFLADNLRGRKAESPKANVAEGSYLDVLSKKYDIQFTLDSEENSYHTTYGIGQYLTEDAPYEEDHEGDF